jgi:hypothetical protein
VDQRLLLGFLFDLDAVPVNPRTSSTHWIISKNVFKSTVDYEESSEPAVQVL